MTTGRALAIWLGSFVIIAVVLAAYFRAPLAPLLAAGGVTLLITVIRFRSNSKR